MRKRARLEKERRIKCTIIAYVVITVVSFILFAILHSVANQFRPVKGFGGELMILLTPILVSLVRANYKLSKEDIPEC
ncbi:MAG: hypothetical protein ACI4RI_03500 [Ruminococcus sp.]